MTIYPKLETRRAKRRNGAAYQHRRLRSLTGGHSVITHGRRMEYQRSHSMFLTHVIAGTASASRSDRASLPRKRAGNAISRDQPTSAPTSTRDEPHVGTHICARPLHRLVRIFRPRQRKLVVVFVAPLKQNTITGHLPIGVSPSPARVLSLHPESSSGVSKRPLRDHQRGLERPLADHQRGL